MTETVLDRGKPHLPQIIAVTLTVIFMLIAILGAAALLKWAVNGKMSSIDADQTSQITTEIRERQLACLAKNIYYEAGGEPFEGKVAVAQVTLNRVASGLFPDDICKTIYQKNIVYEKVVCQFSWTCDRVTGPPPVNKANYRESMEVAKKVLLEGFRLPSLKDALYFHADYVRPNRPADKKVAHIGRHIFYR